MERTDKIARGSLCQDTGRKRERQRHSQREKQAPCREPDMGLDPGTPGSHPGLKTVLNCWATRAALSYGFTAFSVIAEFSNRGFSKDMKVIGHPGFQDSRCLWFQETSSLEGCDGPCRTGPGQAEWARRRCTGQSLYCLLPLPSQLGVPRLLGANCTSGLAHPDEAVRGPDCGLCCAFCQKGPRSLQRPPLPNHPHLRTLPLQVCSQHKQPTGSAGSQLHDPRNQNPSIPKVFRKFLCSLKWETPGKSCSPSVFSSEIASCREPSCSAPHPTRSRDSSRAQRWVHMPPSRALAVPESLPSAAGDLAGGHFLLSWFPRVAASALLREFMCPPGGPRWSPPEAALGVPVWGPLGGETTGSRGPSGTVGPGGSPRGHAYSTLASLEARPPIGGWVQALLTFPRVPLQRFC
ncbi:uncharacterized protein LOC119867064 isoform X1 [Canis lupus familiaris]|uniref:uncharacterized protein LOC119867064 isoform X1 n=1 Tax=Canis lupus familiaris TaxID=9615 RepID=UPI0018F7D6C5|nr:uncharacterized protein LOC119867064 isoform X1 [Canis lupus familiaris]